MNTTTPSVVNLTHVLSLFAAENSMCATISGNNNALQCWGNNADNILSGGQLGTLSHSPMALAVSFPTGALLSGVFGSSTHDVYGVFASVGSTAPYLMGWGDSSLSMLGENPSSTNYGKIIPSFSGKSILQLSTGGFDHGCALFSDHTLECWGNDSNGQLGGQQLNDTVVFPPGNFVSVTPVSVIGLPAVNGDYPIQVSTGYHYTCALMLLGSVQCWGDSAYGKLGIEPIKAAAASDGVGNQLTPIAVAGISPGTVSQVIAGYNSTCALLWTGQMQCWGSNTKGQLGNNMPGMNQSSTPVFVSNLP